MSLRPTRREAVQRLLATGAGTLLAPRWAAAYSTPLQLGGRPVELSLTPIGKYSLRITLSTLAAGLAQPLPDDGALLPNPWQRPAARFRTLTSPRTVLCGAMTVHLTPDPLVISIASSGRQLQQIRVEAGADGTLKYGFRIGSAPLFGLGQGGPQMDKRGSIDTMGSGQGGYKLSTHGAKVPIQVLWSAEGWGLFAHQPLGAFDLTDATTGWLLPRADLGGHEPGEALPGADETTAGLPLDLFVIDGSGEPPGALLAEYATLTGLPSMPPRWAFGYQQSHRTLGAPEEILAEARTFREKQLPCDVMIYLGTGFCPEGWNTANGEFTWNPKAFPDPPATMAALHEQHFKVALHVVLEGHKLTGTVHDPCTAPPLPSGPGADKRWPPDRQVACYWPFHQPLLDLGVDGWWPDQGDGLDAPSRLARNRMYFEGQQLARPNQRVYALHRNGYAGMQRYAAFLWSGDIRSTWETLKTHIAVGINAGLSGIPFWGTDTGGFIPTPEYTGELYARWFQFSAFCPLFRSHGRDWRLHLPWGWTLGEIGYAETPGYRPDAATLHNPAIEPICKQYLGLRYRLLPYLYTAVRDCCITGQPILRALWLDYPDDPTAVARDDEYLFGSDILVAPVVEPGATTRTLYLPRGNWHDFWTGEVVAGGREINRPVDLATLPLYVRAGAVVPTGPVLQYVTDEVAGPMTLTVYPGRDGGGALYEDDGTTFNGPSDYILFTWDDRRRELGLSLPVGTKLRLSETRTFAVKLAGSTASTAITFDGRPARVQLATGN